MSPALLFLSTRRPYPGDIFSQDLLASVAATIDGGIRTFTPYVHPDCGGHHNHDEPEVYVRWCPPPQTRGPSRPGPPLDRFPWST